MNKRRRYQAKARRHYTRQALELVARAPRPAVVHVAFDGDGTPMVDWHMAGCNPAFVRWYVGATPDARQAARTRLLAPLAL